MFYFKKKKEKKFKKKLKMFYFEVFINLQIVSIRNQEQLYNLL